MAHNSARTCRDFFFSCPLLEKATNSRNRFIRIDTAAASTARADSRLSRQAWRQQSSAYEPSLPYVLRSARAHAPDRVCDILLDGVLIVEHHQIQRGVELPCRVVDAEVPNPPQHLGERRAPHSPPG
jgi:hypothetical protein